MRFSSLMAGLSALALCTAPALADVPTFTFEAPAALTEGHVVVFMNDDGELSEGAATLDGVTEGRLSAALDLHEWSPDFGKSVSFNGLAPFKTITVVGTGGDNLTQRQLMDLGGMAAAKAGMPEDVTLITDEIDSDLEGAAAAIAGGYALRSYSFDKYEETKDKGPASVTVQAGDADAAESLFRDDLSHIVEGIYLARDLGTEPGNKVWPARFVDIVERAFVGIDGVEITVLDADDIRREGMGALMGTGMGSIHDPRLLVVSYMNGPRDEAPIALVGKGITFDTGGISIKSNSGMWLMKSDLSGAAAVAGTVLAAAKRGERVNVVGVMPLAENMPSQDAIRPGDVLTTMGGKTIEIMSTDAEGRLILADAVQYAQAEFEPRMLLNIATLTGSAARAVGDDYAVVITRELDLSLDMMEIGKEAGEEVWPLPLHPSHFDQIKSPVATIKNTGGRPGASIGAAVIGTFIDEDLPWVHIDMAGVDWMDSSRHTIPKGHAGWGVRFMDQLLRSEAETD